MTLEQKTQFYRTIFTSTVYLAPFVIGFLAVPYPLNIFAVCLLVLRNMIQLPADHFSQSVYIDYITRKVTREGDADELGRLNTHLTPMALDDVNAECAGVVNGVNIAFKSIESLLIFIGTIAFIVQWMR